MSDIEEVGTARREAFIRMMKNAIVDELYKWSFFPDVTEIEDGFQISVNKATYEVKVTQI